MTHTAAPAFKHSSGPQDAKIALVGEAWGEQEELLGKPFVGYSGQELTKILKDAGINRAECFITNVLAIRPANNDLAALSGSRAEVGKDYAFPPLKSGQYLLPDYLTELDRLKEELETVAPNIVVAMGNVACWALLGSTGITKLRGTVNLGSLVRAKVLPTYHPAAIVRNWTWRVIAVADMMKASREKEFPEIRRPERYAVVDPSFAEMEQWYHTHGVNAEYLAVDIETVFKQVRMVGFGIKKHGICIPLVDLSKPGHHYWPEPGDEILARKWIQRFLDLPCPKVMQNGLYDMQYLLREGFRLRNCSEDTMLLHHALYPELPKGLGFLGSIYSNEAAWKLMRHEKEELKRDE